MRGLRHELHQESVANAAAEDVDRVESTAGERLQPVDLRPETIRQRIVDAADQRGVVGEFALTVFAAVVADAARHVAGREKRGIVEVDAPGLAVERSRHGLHLRERHLAAVFRPDAAGFLQRPRAHDVAETPERPAEAAFVGELGVQCVPRGDGGAAFRPEQGPGPEADVERLLRVGAGHGQHGARRVVGGAFDGADAGNVETCRDLGFEFAGL